MTNAYFCQKRLKDDLGSLDNFVRVFGQLGLTAEVADGQEELDGVVADGLNFKVFAKNERPVVEAKEVSERVDLRDLADVEEVTFASRGRR